MSCAFEVRDRHGPRYYLLEKVAIVLWQALGSASGEGQQEGMELRTQAGRSSTSQGWPTANHCPQSCDLVWFAVCMSYLTHHTTALLQACTRGKPKVKTNHGPSNQPTTTSFPAPTSSPSSHRFQQRPRAPGPCRYTSHQVTGLGSGSVAAFPKT